MRTHLEQKRTADAGRMERRQVEQLGTPFQWGLVGDVGGRATGWRTMLGPRFVLRLFSGLLAADGEH